MAKAAVPEKTQKITFRPDPGDITILRELQKAVPNVENISDAVRHCIRTTAEHYDIKPMEIIAKEKGTKEKIEGGAK